MTGPRPLRLLLLGATLIGGVACKSDNRRDRFYSTDVGIDWMPDPNATIRPHDAAGEEGGVDAGPGGREAGTDGPDAAVDSADAGPDTIDAPGETG
jgi:hypothetical protein